MTELCDITNGENPFSLVNLINSDALSKAIVALPLEYRYMAEDELRKIASPNQTDEMIRLRLWGMYNNCITTGRTKIDVTKVMRGICDRNYVYRNLMLSPERLAFVVNPPKFYDEALEAMLPKVLETYNELLSMNIHGKDGGVDVNKGKLKLQAAQAVENRAKGSPIQRTVKKEIIEQTAEFEDLTDIEDKIKALEEKAKEQDSNVKELPGVSEDVGEEGSST